MVEMTVVVRDGKSKPDTDLTREDFTVNDGGKQQVISIFESHNGENLQQAAAALPAGYFSNRLEYRGGVPSSVTALLIDLVNTPAGYWGRARPHFARFLRQADPRQRIAIYVLNHGGAPRQMEAPRHGCCGVRGACIQGSLGLANPGRPELELKAALSRDRARRG